MKIKNRANLLLGAFLAVCLVPSVGMLVLPPQEAATNQVLAPPPQLRKADGSLNPTVLNETADYVADHLGLRQEIITANAALNAALFGVSTQDQVVLGREGWLYYAETIPDHLGTEPMSEGALFGAARSLALLQEYVQSQGARLYVTVAPNKATLYPQYLPDLGTPLPGESNLERLIPLLEGEGLSYVDLYTPLSQAGEILYYRTDSHWTEPGAALAHDVLVEAMGKTDQTPFYGGATQPGPGKRGDLYEMLYPAGAGLEESPVYQRGYAFTYARPMRSPEDQLIETASSKSGRLLMYRDSFGNSLHTYLADAYGAALFSRSMPYDLSLLPQFQPDTVLLEICERNLDWWGQQAPIFPAPIRALQGTPPVGEAQPTLSVQSDGRLPGMLRVEGVLRGAVDETSPIYVQSGGVLYEACPVGDRSAGVPFALYVPQEGWDGRCAVLYQADQSLYTTPVVTESERNDAT